MPRCHIPAKSAVSLFLPAVGGEGPGAVDTGAFSLSLGGAEQNHHGFLLLCYERFNLEPVLLNIWH